MLNKNASNTPITAVQIVISNKYGRKPFDAAHMNATNAFGVGTGASSG